jgi:protein involved in polysaccharide export with SLBB domain
MRLMRKSLSLTLLSAALATALLTLAQMHPAAAQQAAVQQAVQAEYTLGAGDKLEVTVFGHTDLSGTFDVDGAGQISLPLIGQIVVLGMTAGQAEKVIRERLTPDYLKNPRVSLQVLNYRPFYIIGEVKQPGSYPYVNGLTVIQAVALAGGFTYRAKEKKIVVQRASDAARQKRQVRQTDAVLPGDIIEVPERYF